MANPFGDAFTNDSGVARALRSLALQKRESLSGQDLGSPEDYETGVWKQIGNAFLGRKLGVQPFGPAALPTPDLGLSPEEIEKMPLEQRLLLLEERPEQLLPLLTLPEGIFERMFPRFGSEVGPIQDEGIRGQLEMADLESRADALPGGRRTYERMLQRRALDEIAGESMKEILSLEMLRADGTIGQEYYDTRVAQILAADDAATRAAMLAPDQAVAGIRQSEAAAGASRASAAESYARIPGIEATTEKTLVETEGSRVKNLRERVGLKKDVQEVEQAAQGQLLQFVMPDGSTKIVREFSPEAAEIAPQAIRVFSVGTAGTQLTSASDAFGTPQKGEVQEAGEALRSGVTVGRRIAKLFAQVGDSDPKAFGPIAERVRSNQFLGAIAAMSPEYGEYITEALTGMSNESFARFRTDIDLLVTQLVEPITREKSRFSDSERAMVTLLAGPDAGTTREAYIGKLKAIRDLQVLNDDKLGIVSQQASAQYQDMQFPDRKGFPGNDAYLAKEAQLKQMGYEGRDLAEAMWEIQEQRIWLAERGAAGGSNYRGSLDELVPQE